MQNDKVAGFFVRLLAYILDSALIGFGLLALRIVLFFAPIPFLTKTVLFSFSLMDILTYVLGAVYFIVLTYFCGQTIGKMIMGIKVVSTEDRDLRLFEVVLRETICRYLCELFFCIGYILVGVDSLKRGLHDRICDTRVITVK